MVEWHKTDFHCLNCLLQMMDYNICIQQSKRKPGQSHEDRTVGTEDEKVHKRLKTIDRHEADSEQDSESQVSTGSSLHSLYNYYAHKSMWRERGR